MLVADVNITMMASSFEGAPGVGKVQDQKQLLDKFFTFMNVVSWSAIALALRFMPGLGVGDQKIGQQATDAVGRLTSPPILLKLLCKRLHRRNP